MTGKQLVVAHALLLLACAGGASPDPRAEPSPAAAVPSERAPAKAEVAQSALTRIGDPSKVCMVNDQHMGVAQIPVAVEGKTYFGCCEMCEARLKTDPKLRFATDPATQQPVDKATAVLAMDARGKVLYFESESSMQQYAARL